MKSRRLMAQSCQFGVSWTIFPPTIVIVAEMSRSPPSINGERIGGQDSEIRQLAGLQRALLAFIEGEIGAACSRAAQSFCPSDRLFGRDTLFCEAFACNDLPDRPEHRDWHVVGCKSHLHAGIEQIAHWRDLVVAFLGQTLLPRVTLLVDVTVGVSGQDYTHARNSLDITWGQDRDMTKHPAAALQWNLTIHFLEQVEHV